MFALKVHSVDSDRLVGGEGDGGFTLVSRSSGHHPCTTVLERRGVAHLFRARSPDSSISLQGPSSSSALFCVIAVPNYFSSDEFLRFCGTHLYNVSEVLFLRNDAMEDRYSVIVKLRDHLKADDFRCSVNGKRFSISEREVCHVLSMVSVEYTDSAIISSMPPSGFTELPTCPVCIERLDHDTSGISAAPCDHSFHCSCISRWTYLSCQVCQLCEEHDGKLTCSVCGTTENLWACMICGFVGCGRYKEGHAIQHWKERQHSYSLDLGMQWIWDYEGDTYVHRLNQLMIDGDESVIPKFCCGSAKGEHSRISGALYDSKLEAITDEYNCLLATQLEAQRKHYEGILSDARSSKERLIREGIETVVASRMLDISHELDQCLKRKNAAMELNKKLLKDEQAWRERATQAEERKKCGAAVREAKLVDLEEQVRDLAVYIKAQSTIGAMKDGDIRGGTLSLPSIPPPSSSLKKHKKLNRVRR